MRSLQTRILIVFSALILISGALISLIIFRSSEDLITKSIGEQAKKVAEYAAKSIDTEKYRNLGDGGEENPYYKELRVKLNEIREANGLKYLYTVGERKTDGKAEYVYMVDGQPLDAKGEDISQLGDPVESEYAEIPRGFQEKVAQIGEMTKDEEYGALITTYVPILAADGEMLGLVGADFDAGMVYELMAENRWKVAYVTAAILLVSMIAIYLVARFIVKPLRKLSGDMVKIQEGDLTVKVGYDRKDEIGTLSRSLQQMVDDLRSVIGEVQQSASELAESSSVLSSRAAESNRSSREITERIQQVAAGSETQVRRSDETARAMDEVSGGMRKIAEASTAAAEASRETAGVAVQGNSHVRKAMSQMESIQASTSRMAQDVQRLGERSDAIMQITDVMSGIAAQTSLLALNAAIEAARAGEEGRGFAVVADQIRKLSVQSEESAKQVGELVMAIVTDTDKVVTSIGQEEREVRSGLVVVQEAEEAFRRILVEVEKAAEQVEAVSAVSLQLATGSGEAAASVEEMARIAKDSALHYRHIADSSREQLALLEQITQSSGNLTNMAQRLQSAIAKFKA